MKTCNKFVSLLCSGSLFFLWFALDRLTKYWAVTRLATESIPYNDYLSFSLAWNRGISWSLLHSNAFIPFLLLTSTIALVIVTFTVYTYMQYKKNLSIFFETFVLAGAFSNLVDRLWYGAVVDFIEMRYKSFYWPTFNIADACIVFGIVGIMIKTVYESYDHKS